MIKGKQQIVSLLIFASLSFFPMLVLSAETRKTNDGIGISIAQIYDGKRKDRKGRIVILDVYQNSAGDEAGLEKGDVITHVDGRATKGRDLSKVIMNLLSGDSGTTVELKIYRMSPERLINLYVVRGSHKK